MAKVNNTPESTV